jgi:GT2 family glycosyltransferase
VTLKPLQDRPLLSIIIVNYRTWQFIERNLDNLLASLPEGTDPASLPLEVVVADNSPDETGMQAFCEKFPWVRVVRTGGNFGYGFAGNSGAEVATGDWLLFMNPDVICDWENLRALLDAGRDNPDWHILSAPQYGMRPRRLQRVFAAYTGLWTYFATMRMLLRLLMPSRYPEPRRDPAKMRGILGVDWVSGSLMLMSRETFDRLGGWDDDYFLYREDEDICRRAHESGMRVGYFPGASFVHSHASSTRANPETRVLTKSETALSTYLYLLKHEKGMSGRLLRFIMRLQTWTSLPLLELAGRLSGRSIPRLEQKRRIQRRLLAYYRRVARTGIVVSDMSVNYPGNRASVPPDIE